jgi:hypothetical protein
VSLVHNFMKPLLLAACFASVLSARCWGQLPCHAVVLASVTVTDHLSLADLLGPETCAELSRVAARVRLGAAPLWGSERVLDGGQVRSLVERIAKAGNLGGSVMVHAPERIRIQRAGVRASCADIEAKIFSAPADQGLSSAATGAAALHQMDCGVSGQISRDTPLEVQSRVWDPGLHSWNVQVRCRRPGDCVPFLVRGKDLRLRMEAAPHREPIAAPASALVSPDIGAAPVRSGAKPLVRPGQAAILVWDQDGIRAVVPAICLDNGDEGDIVRARVTRGGIVMRAIVIGAGRLRAAS